MTKLTHIPVLLKEVLEWMNPQEGDVYVDATLGLGGHSKEILEKIGKSGFLIGIDRDLECLQKAKIRLSSWANLLEVIHGNYSDIKVLFQKKGEAFASGILLDLGISSLQIDKKERGFSFRKDDRLDMRMDQKSDTDSAFDFVNYCGEKELADIFYKYGQERYSRRIARQIVQKRKQKPITTTFELAEIALFFYRRYSRIHPATRIFQALRIAVNQELFHLEKFLAESLFCLKKGGTLCIISYHSLEDRCVKQSFKNFFEKNLCKKLHSKPIRPTQEEILKNKRSRSAKMRICQKL